MTLIPISDSYGNVAYVNAENILKVTPIADGYIVLLAVDDNPSPDKAPLRRIEVAPDEDPELYTVFTEWLRRTVWFPSTFASNKYWESQQ